MTVSINRLTTGYPAAPIILAQNAIPFVLPSGNGVGVGVIGNNGALSAITALPTTYTACYMYFPVNAIAAGVAAGWYYTVMSSTTAGTIYNNTYTSGTQTIPASPTAFVTTGPGNFTQTTGNIASVSITIPGGAIGTNGSLRINHDIQTIANANAKLPVIKLATVLIHQITATTYAVWQVLFSMKNRGVANKQICTRTNTSEGASAASSNFTYTTIDTSVDTALIFYLDMATNTDFMVLEGFTIEVLPG